MKYLSLNKKALPKKYHTSSTIKKSSLSRLCEKHGNIRYLPSSKRHFVTMEVREFIKALTQHILDQNCIPMIIKALTIPRIIEMSNRLWIWLVLMVR
jgi:hypothetical protein